MEKIGKFALLTLLGVSREESGYSSKGMHLTTGGGDAGQIGKMFLQQGWRQRSGESVFTFL